MAAVEGMSSEVEFEVGQTVTYKPYELDLPAQVKEVLPNHWGDGRVIYHLTADYKREVVDGRVVITRPVKTYTGGDHIVESRYYVGQNVKVSARPGEDGTAKKGKLEP
jgi:hypothetical protein